MGSAIAALAAMSVALPAKGQAGLGDPNSIALLEAIKAQARAHSQAYEYVRELSDSIGPRLTGTPQALKACAWATQKMKHAGLQNVHLEQWHMSRGWQRGYARARLIAPFPLDLDITSYGWVGSTKPGGVDSEVVLVNSDLLADDVAQHGRLWKGKLLFLMPLGPKHKNPIRVFSELAGFLASAAKAQALGVIYPGGRPGIMLTHAGPAAFRDSFFPIPVVDIAQEQQKLLERLLAKKVAVRLSFDVQNVVTPGPVVCHNVVGDLPGAEDPDEVVLLCAHLDSWDIGTGSIDDGVGVAAVLSAADTILSQHVRARRTLRFVLFTGEEEGLLGSLAYVRAHRSETKNFVAAFALDWGSGPIVKLPLAGRVELEPAFEGFAQLMQDIGQIQVDASYLAFTDGYAFTLAGMPGVAPLQDSPNYVLLGHSAADTLDKVDSKNLIQNTALFAAMGFWAANYPNRLGRTWTAAETRNALVRDNQRTMLELAGLWSFGK